jgi:streptogramin lyase
MKSTYLFILVFLVSNYSQAQTSYNYSWRYYTTGNTGILGDYAEGLLIDSDGNPYIAAYTPGFEEGGFSKYLRSENEWINYSNVEYPVIGSIYDVGASRISEMTKAADGTIWMAGWRGILHFDPAVGGSSLQFWGFENSLHPGGRTMDIDIAPDGSVWAAVYSVTWGGGGLVHFDPANNAWRLWDYGSNANNWPSLIGTCENLSIQVKPGGGYQVWIDGEGWNTMITFDSDTQLFTLLPQNNESGEIVALPGSDCIDEEGNLWALRNTGPGNPFSIDYLTPEGNWVTPQQPESEIVADIWAFKATGNHEALITGLNSEVWQFDGENWQSKGIWREGAYSYGLDIDADGNIWVTGVGGAARRDVTTGFWQRYHITNSSQIDYWVQDMDIDMEGNVWMTGNAGPGVGGFQRFDGTHWTGFNEENYGLGYGFPFPTDNTMEIYRRPSNGDVIINPMYEGLHGWNTNGYYALTGSYPESKGLTEDSEGRLWNLGGYYALQFYENNGWTEVEITGSGANIENDLSLPGTVWACTGYQVLRTNGVTSYSKTVFDFPELDPQSDALSTVIPANEGVVWFGSNKGLFRLNTIDDTYDFYTNSNSEIAGESITPLAFTTDGRIWYTSFGSSESDETGLGWFDGTNFGFFPVEDGGLPHAQVIDAEVITKANGYELWLCCLSRGIAILDVGINTVGIAAPENPSADILLDCYPNPFNENTSIRFALSSTDHVSLSIYSITGIPVAVIIDKQLNAGNHVVNWNTSDVKNKVSSGMYIARITTSTFTKSIRLIVQ